MKKTVILMMMVLLTGSFLLTAEATAQTKSPTEVYYFHMTRRCTTCQTVETVVKEAVNEFFADAVKKGDVTFKSVNIEEKENKALVKKLKINGQTLLVVNGKDQVNLTDKAFMQAVSEPAKLKAEVKSAVEKVTK